MQGEMQKPQQARRPNTEEQNNTYQREGGFSSFYPSHTMGTETHESNATAPSAPQEDHSFNPDSAAIESYLQSLNLEKTTSPQTSMQTPVVQQVKKEPQKVVQTIPQLVPNNYSSAMAASGSSNPTSSTLLQPTIYVPQQQPQPALQPQSQPILPQLPQLPQLQQQQQQQQQMQQQMQHLQQMQQVRQVIAPVSKESQQLDQLAFSVAGLSNQMQQVVKSLGHLDERLTSLETKVDTVILKQRTLEDLSRDNNRLIQKREESKPIPVASDIYNVPPSTYAQTPTNALPYNAGAPVMGTPIQPQMATPVQYISPTVPATYTSPPQNVRPPVTAPSRPVSVINNNPGAGLYPGMTAVQPKPVTPTTPKPSSVNAPRVTVKFDERLITDVENMGFERQVIVDTLYELYSAGQPANDIQVLLDRITAKVGR